MSSFRIFRFAAMVAVAISGCVGSTLPQPPGINPDFVTADSPEVVDFATVAGAAGAAAYEEGARIRIWNLEDPLAPAETLVNPDGSFTVMVTYVGGDELRLQIIYVDGTRSAPLDVLGQASGAVVPSARPTCSSVPLWLDLGDARAAELPLANVDCADDVVVERVELRVGEPALEIDAPSSIRLPSGSSATLSVRATGLSPVEDILFVYVTVDAVEHRYPVTLVAP